MNLLLTNPLIHFGETMKKYLHEVLFLPNFDNSGITLCTVYVCVPALVFAYAYFRVCVGMCARFYICLCAELCIRPDLIRAK